MSAADPVLFGFASRPITPPDGMPVSLAGAFSKRMAEGAAGEIHVRVLVLRQGERNAAIAIFDLVSISSDFHEILLETISGPDGFDRDNIIFTATHSHTAPEVRSNKPGYNPDYPPFAAARFREALDTARAAMQPGTFATGWGDDRRFAFNRRYWMTDGTVVTNPRRADERILRAEGPVDPEIPVLRITAPDGRQCVLANIVNHADTCGGREVFADWPGIFCRELEAELPPGSMAVSITGCAGNINHLNPYGEADQRGPHISERLGKGYAETVGQILARMQPMAPPALRMAKVDVTSPPREITDAEREEAEAVLEELRDCPDAEDDNSGLHADHLAQRNDMVRKYFAKANLSVAADRRERRYSLVGFRIGHWAIAGLSGEPFAEVGMAIRQLHFPGTLLMLAENANGTGAPTVPGTYIPNAWNFGRGGYETTPRSSPQSITTAERIIAAAGELAKRLSP